MRKLFTLSIAILVFSCLSESNVDPGSSSTFIRYFNGGNNDEAKDLELASGGGFMVLATTKIQKAEADKLHSKIKLIKTDAAGNAVWQKLYPGFSITDRDYLASNIERVPGGGYVMTGEVIQPGAVINSTVSKTFVMLIDDNGVPKDSIDLVFAPNVDERGKAVAVDSVRNVILVLSTYGDEGMILTELDKTTLDVSLTVPPVAYAQGATKLANRLLVDSDGKAVWSGTAIKAGLSGIRLLKVAPGSSVADFDFHLSEPDYTLAGFDFCRYGDGYAIGGATNKKPDNTAATDTDILYYKIQPGSPPEVASFPFDNPDTPQNEDNQIDAGNALNTTLDGGLIFLSSVNSAAIEGRGDSDFYLIKIDGFGDKEWTSSFGSKFKDEGVCIQQLKDGSYVALGTTTQGSLKILTLFKTNSKGKID